MQSNLKPYTIYLAYALQIIIPINILQSYVYISVRWYLR